MNTTQTDSSDVAQTTQGLTSAAAKQLLAQYGPNALITKKKNPFGQFVRWFISPIPLMLIAAAGLSFFNSKIADAGLILTLLIANYVIQLWHEHKADQAVAKLEAHLAHYARVKRDGQWQRIPAADIVPGDFVTLRVGSLIPADITLTLAENVAVDESMLTGESLPREKQEGDTVYSAAYVTTGTAQGVVTATGTHTYFGAAVKTLDTAKKRSALEADILSISKVLAVLALFAIVILTIVFAIHGNTLSDIATLDISLIIAGIPVALPTVMSLIISAGVLQVARGGAVVRRLSALEDLANVNLLLSDKTGTLTQNKIRVASVVLLNTHSEMEALALAASATDQDVTSNPLENAVQEAAKAKNATVPTKTAFTPGDSQRKRGTATIKKDGKTWTVSLGAPPTVAELCQFTNESKQHFTQAVNEAAERGDRALLLAAGKTDTEKDLEPIALLFLADALRTDANATVKTMQDQGIGVKMLTGDGLPIAKEVAQALELPGTMYQRAVFDDPSALASVLPEAAGFAEVLPKDKYAAVEAAKRYAHVAVTGDGANDIPSVSNADVGIAVAHSVDALRETADIVLLTDGLTVIATAIRQARMVFMRLYHYSLYRLSESIELIFTILLLGILVGRYPMTPVQVLLLAFLNDVPIITIAFDRVHVPHAPTSINNTRRSIHALFYGFAGILGSLSTFGIAYYYLHLPWGWVQTLFFLQLVVSGHMLIYIAHTEDTWFRWLPSWQIITATSLTQLFATLWAAFGILTAAIPWWVIGFVWAWSFLWMQITALVKAWADRLTRTRKPFHLAANQSKVKSVAH